jgi:hypothetical protein
VILVYDFEIIKVFFSLSLFHYNVWEFLPLKINMRLELRVTQKRENKKNIFFPSIFHFVNLLNCYKKDSLYSNNALFFDPQLSAFIDEGQA